MSLAGLLVWVGIAVPSVAAAEVFLAGPSDDVEALINALQPGDELVLSGGMYTLSERFSFAIAGTESEAITIRAADGEVPHLHRPNANQNIIDIDQAEHVTIRGIEFSGGSAGIRISGARFLTIEGCEVHDTGDVAIRANDSGVTYESLRILGNHIHHTNNTGEGMYLGCNNAGCEVTDSLIEGNYIHHTNQPSVSQGDGIELKEGSSGNVIRDNVIHDTNYPCILTYATNGAQNVIERNVMWNCGDHGIQSAADAVIRNNIILGANADGIAMQPHQSGSPSELIVRHNTVLNAGGDAVSLRGISGSVVIANNALYAQDGWAFFVNGGTSGLVFAGNAGMGGASDAGLAVLQGDITVDQTSDKEGRAEIRIPAFRERVELDVTHPGGTETLGVTVTDATNYEHVALQWTGPQVLKMHAYEFGARRNQFGHVWSGAPKSPIRAARGSGGFLTGLGDGSGASAEIYSFPAGETPVRGVVRLIVEAEVTESTCDSDVRATAHQTGALSRMTATEVEFKMPGCDTVGDIVQLQNLLRDMRLAGR